MLDLSDEYDRYGRKQRKLARKEHGSNDWGKQRRTVATAKRQTKRKALDYRHELTTWQVQEHDLVAVEGLGLKPMLETSRNANNKQDAAWSRFFRPLGVQNRPAWYSRRSSRTSGNDQRVFGVRCGNVETTPDSGTLFSGVRPHRGQGSERGEEHPFSRSLTDRGGTLRMDIRTDCAPYGNPLGSCKARRRSRNPRGRTEDGAFRDLQKSVSPF